MVVVQKQNVSIIEMCFDVWNQRIAQKFSVGLFDQTIDWKYRSHSMKTKTEEVKISKIKSKFLSYLAINETLKRRFLDLRAMFCSSNRVPFSL
jgi:hypothetical protein